VEAEGSVSTLLTPICCVPGVGGEHDHEVGRVCRLPPDFPEWEAVDPDNSLSWRDAKPTVVANTSTT